MPHESLYENLSLRYLTRSDTNWAVQPRKMARGLKSRIEFRKRYCTIYEAKGGTNQLRGYQAADLALVLEYAKLGFLMTLLMLNKML